MRSRPPGQHHIQVVRPPGGRQINSKDTQNFEVSREQESGRPRAADSLTVV